MNAMLNLPVDRYAELLAEKQQKLTALLSPFAAPDLQVFTSPTQHFRMRAEFRIWHEGDDFYHIMFDQQSKQRYQVDQFPIASELINRMMAALLPLLKQQMVLHHRLFQIDYLSTQSQQIIVSLLYHKTLDEDWQPAAQALRSQLQQQGFNVQIVGRASKQKICLEQDYVDEILCVHGKDYIYRQVENSFTQPNAAMNSKMLEWAVDCTRNSQGDLLELYCGNGNFTLPLSQHFNQVLATEVSKTSVNAAQWNIEANQITNLKIARLSAEEFTEAYTQNREFRRLQEQGIDLKNYDFSTIFVDPPRAGVDDETLKLVARFDNVLYISCNPETLRTNLDTLCQTHTIERAALFDQFPFTHHIESSVWLKKK